MWGWGYSFYKFKLFIIAATLLDFENLTEINGINFGLNFTNPNYSFDFLNFGEIYFKKNKNKGTSNEIPGIKNHFMKKSWIKHKRWGFLLTENNPRNGLTHKIH